MVNKGMLIIEFFSCMYCLAELYGKKLKINIYIVALAIIDMFIASAIDDYGFPKYFMLIFYICLFLYALSYYGEGIKRTLINYFLTMLIMVTFQFVIFLPLYLIYYKNFGEIDINEFLISLLSFILIVLISYKISFKKISDFFVKINKLVVCVCTLLLGMISINYLKIKNTGDIYGEVYIQLIFFIGIFAFIIYEWQKARLDAEKKKTQLEMNRLYYDAYDKLILLIRERQHDLRNHINAILSMIYTIDNYDELVANQTEYCNEVMKRNENTRLVLLVDNPLIAGFLYNKIQEAEEKDIKIDYLVTVSKTMTVMSEYELVDMAGVLIDNAIDALSDADNEKTADLTQKIIYVSMKENDEFIELIVANTCDTIDNEIIETFFEPGYSTKGSGRGIGLYKLKHIVSEKSGDIIVNNEMYKGHNCLEFKIKIPIKKGIISRLKK